jgi:hypothetical protein
VKLSRLLALIVLCVWGTSVFARINTSKASGLWSSSLTWSAGTPLVTDTIVIRSTDVVTFNVTGVGTSCNALTVNGTLNLGSILSATRLRVNNDIIVAAGGKIQVNTAATHTLFVSGNIINNGTIDLSPTATKICNITFNKNGNASLSGTGILNHYNLITLNMGVSINNTLTISSSKFTTRAAATPFLTMLNGTFNFTSPAAGPFLLFNGNTTLASSCGITINNAVTSFNTSAGSLTLLGKLNLSAGTLNLGTVADNDLIINGGSIAINGGTLKLAGKFYEMNAASTASFSMSAGSFTLPTVTPLATGIAPFQLSNAASSFSMSGGNLIIQQNGGGANLGFINNNTGGVISGGNIQFGNAALAANRTLSLSTNRNIPNLILNSNRVKVSLSSAIQVLNNLTITAGTLLTNSNSIQLAGNWSDSGTFTPGTSTVTFNGNSAQSISKAGGETFYALATSGTGTTSLLAAVTVTNNFSIGAGSVFDVSAANLVMTVSGNWSDAGIFVCRTGTVNLNGPAAQAITDAAGETFNILNLTGAGIKTLGGPVTVNSTFTIGAGSALDVSAGNFAFTVKGNWTDNGTFTCQSGTVTLSGASQTITKAGSETFNNIIVSGSGTKTLAITSMLINQNLSINSGSVLDIGGGLSPITISGNWTDAGTFTCRTGTVTFNGATAQSITDAAGETFNNLILSGAGLKSLGGPLTTNANFTISAGASLDVSPANYSLTIGGNWSDSGTFKARSGTVSLNKAAAQTITDPAGETFNNLSLSSAAAVFTKSLACPVLINGNLTIAASTTFDVSASNYQVSVNGNWINNGTFNPRSGTVILGGAAQSITRAIGETLYNVSFAGTGIKTLGSQLTLNANLTIAAGVTLDVSTSNFGLILKGNWTNNGSFLAQGGTLQLTGIALQTLAGASVTTFNSIILNNASGCSLASDANLVATLTPTKGTFTVQAGKVFTLISTATGTGNIATIPVAGNFVGNITMQRFVSPGKTGWYFLGAPISSAITLANWNSSFYMTGFSGSNNPSYSFVSEYTYNESVTGSLDQGYVAATNITNPVAYGKGYWCYIGPVPLTISVSGTAGKGNFNFPVTYTPTAPAAANKPNDGWNLISNPYPSSIDWSLAGGGTWTKTNISGAIYIWNPSTSTYSSWVGGVSTNGGSNILSSSQGFWVQANAAGPVLTITEKCKTNTNTSYYRTAASVNQSTLKLVLSGNSYKDETVVHFDDSASMHFDSDLDAYKMLSQDPAAPNISTITDSADLSINSMPLTGGPLSIPVRVLVGKGYSGIYTISRDSIMTLSLGSCIILEDLLTGIQTDLRSTSKYSFSITDTTQAPRFILHLSRPLTKQTFSTICPTSADGYAVATANGTACSYTWTNAQQTILQVHTNVSGNDTLHNLASGIYSVSVSGNTGACPLANDTFAVISPATLTPFVMVSNASCKNSADGSITVGSVLGGTPPFAYKWSDGSAGQVLNGLKEGSYTLQIRDARSCLALPGLYLVPSNSSLKALFDLNVDTIPVGTLVSALNHSLGSGSYTWNYGDGSSPDTALDGKHTYANPGIYTVSLLASDGSCSDTMRKKVSVYTHAPLAIPPAKSLSDQIVIGSGAGRCEIQFNLDSQEQVEILLYDLTGQIILNPISVKAFRNSYSLPIQQLPVGIYLVQVRLKTEIINKRIRL